MPDGGDVGVKGAGAEIVKTGLRGRERKLTHIGQNGGQGFLPIGLTDRAEPNRRRIIELVGEGERTAGDLVEALAGREQAGAAPPRA